MEIFVRFKKDYANYLVSIIVPAIISGISIPAFKRLLGADGYGQYALWVNAILISSGVLTGWCTQSILRFYPLSNNNKAFVFNSLEIARLRISIFLVPLIFAAWYISSDWLLTLLSSLALITYAAQSLIVPVAQSQFLSKKIIHSELIRVIIYVIGGIILLLTTKIFYLYVLLFTFTLSYFSSFLYLRYRVRSVLHYSAKNNSANIDNTSHLIKKFWGYGIPVSFWFVFSYLLTYIDKLFSYHFLGARYQGNYQAIFDIISKSLGLLILPAVTALFPLLSKAYEAGEKRAAKELIIKILIYESLGLFTVALLYWWFGANLMLYILDIPATYNYKMIGFIVICGTFIWQFAILLQKRYELNLRTHLMLMMIVVAFFGQLLLYFLFRSNVNEYIAPLGYLTASIVYAFLLTLPGLSGNLRSRFRFINKQPIR